MAKKPDGRQLALPFEAPPNAPPIPRVRPSQIPVSVTAPAEQSPLIGEVLAPSDSTSSASQWTLGEREHALLVRDADKYEARLYKAMKAFIFAVILDVAVNGGLPVAQALLRRYELPPLNDSMLSGVCGLAAIAFACAMLFFYARFRTSSRQLWLNLDEPVDDKHDWARWLAGDAVAFVRNVAWHIAPTQWKTETKPSIAP
jgi:hypothetical protein